MLEAAKRWFGGIAGTVGRFETETGAVWPWPTTNDSNNRGRIIGQNVQVVQTDVSFDQVNFGAHIGSSDLVIVPLGILLAVRLIPGPLMEDYRAAASE